MRDLVVQNRSDPAAAAAARVAAAEAPALGGDATAAADGVIFDGNPMSDERQAVRDLVVQNRSDPAAVAAARVAAAAAPALG